MIKRTYKSYSFNNYLGKKIYQYDRNQLKKQHNRAKWIVNNFIKEWGGMSRVSHPHNLDSLDKYWDGYGYYDYAKYIQDR